MESMKLGQLVPTWKSSDSFSKTWESITKIFPLDATWRNFSHSGILLFHSNPLMETCLILILVQHFTSHKMHLTVEEKNRPNLASKSSSALWLKCSLLCGAVNLPRNREGAHWSKHGFAHHHTPQYPHTQTHPPQIYCKTSGRSSHGRVVLPCCCLD